MTSLVTSIGRPAGLAFALVATALPASAQIWTYEPDVPRAGVYEPRPYYEPRAYEAPAYAPVVSAPPLALTPAQRTTIYRTIIPQGRGRGPIVRERIVTESVAPAPVARSVSRPRLPRTPTQSALASRTLLRSPPCRRRLPPRFRPCGPTGICDQQSPAAGRSDDGHRRCRGERLAHARHETKVWVWRLSRRTTAAAAQEK
jgi:hypothetical protein